MTEPRPDITRTVLAVLTILALMLSTFWILRPFLGAMIWATAIVVATWPALLAVQRFCRGRRAPAVAILSLALLGILFVPFVLSLGAIVEHSDAIVAGAHSLSTLEVPPMPGWVEGLPVVGPKAAEVWNGVVGQRLQELAVLLAPYARTALQWLGGKIGGVGYALLQFLLTVVMTAVLWTNGETAAGKCRRFARRLGGERGESVLLLAGQAIRGVALGVVVTALAQSILGGFGLWVAGVPFASMLTAVMFMLSIAQLGPFLVLLPAAGWVFWSGSIGWGIFLVVWTLFVGTFDNFLRPILIKKGADLPLLLVFAGVIGGLMTLGLIGIFVGPVVLAVAHTLIEAWGQTPANEPDPAI